MFNINNIYCIIKPKKFESLNNGIWYYNFNIETETIIKTDMEGELQEVVKYKYCLVRISGNPTVNKCYEAVLKAYTDESGTTLFNTLNNPDVNDEVTSLVEDLYEMVLIDLGVKELPTELESEIKKVLKAIEVYDASPEVNSFFLNNNQVWLDKSTRVGLMNSLNIEKSSGKATSTLWFGNIKLTINTDAAIQMLSSLELYALSCYNKTAEHKVNVLNLTSVEDVDNYDYTSGYPEKLVFNI